MGIYDSEIFQNETWLWLLVGAAFVVSILRGIFGKRDHEDDEATKGEIELQQQERKKRQHAGAASSSSSSSSSSFSSSKNDPAKVLPRIDYEDDEAVDPTRVGNLGAAQQPVPAVPIVYDREAAIDEPTHANALILTSAFARTDPGRRRMRNEDSLLVADDDGLYIVADGMGGHAGGAIASNLAVETIATAFKEGRFEGSVTADIPRRASELARAIHMANATIREVACANPRLEGMGTTICAARFSPNKQRLYVGHVGDSRIYRLRGGRLKQITADHTMADLGVTGPTAEHLSRAVGVWPMVPIDVVFAKPMPGDVYLLCSDGLTKMVSNDVITDVLANERPKPAVSRLISEANHRGGKDNITVIVVHVSASRLAA